MDKDLYSVAKGTMFIEISYVCCGWPGDVQACFSGDMERNQLRLDDRLGVKCKEELAAEYGT